LSIYHFPASNRKPKERINDKNNKAGMPNTAPGVGTPSSLTVLNPTSPENHSTEFRGQASRRINFRNVHSSTTARNNTFWIRNIIYVSFPL
jgi:hypothetical protein